ncbi:hypothetical protein [Streptomyces bugieae]|uniref:Uncharacterized protein n=1 Tax=Streptomyces bugieae TaxID=3098223 RepID=A0ABU7NMC9_9ACTN|nr:hypothetical protein [Streptomyces sp. DSM 41528]
MLSVEEQYGSPWDGHGNNEDRRNKGQRNMAHVDAAEAVFAVVVPQFRS